mgnify:FL=1
MNQQATFANQANAVVIGATGGIGRAIVAGLAQDGQFKTVQALSRSGASVPFASFAEEIDITDEYSVQKAAESVAQSGPVDLVFVATGVLHRGQDIQPEKSLRELSPAAMQDVFLVNSIGPAIVAKHFLPLMRKGHKSVFAALSARVGSIGDNRLGGWLSYRASKAALNMTLKTLSIEQARRFPDCIVVGLHPGTVDTHLSKPFSKRVPQEKLFLPEQSATRLLEVIDQLDTHQSGQVIAWDGNRIID